MDDFERELKIGFLDEAGQLLTDTEQCFLALESETRDPGTLDNIFRLAHNLKGSAKAVGFAEMGDLTHQLESLLLKMKSGEVPVQTETVSLLLRCNDHVRVMIDGLRENLDATFDSTQLLSEIQAVMNGEIHVSAPPAAQVGETSEVVPDAQADGWSEEVPNNVLDLPVVSAAKAASVAAAKPEERKSSGGAAPEESIRVSFARLEKLLNFVGEMVILQTVLREQAGQSATPLMRRTVDQLGKVTKEVQDISMSLRMVPLKATVQKMHRIVRDTAKALGKQVNLELIGEDTEVDKTVLERLGDPLVHLVRNAVDHGIESAELRKERGKPELGTISLGAFHRSGSLVIEIKDDGGGLDPARLRAKAIEKGILREGSTISDKEAYQLIFAAGFSTKTDVTDVSGRGVGMDVVRTNIELLQGEIQIETGIGKGSCFRIVLPLTLAIIDGMIIRSNNERYVIPLVQVHESLQPQAADVKVMTGIGEILLLRGENLPLFRLSHLLASKAPHRNASDCIAIVIRTNDKPFAVLVDDIIGQQQVVIKSLGKELQGVKGFSGSVILGDGRPSLILEVQELISKARPILIPQNESSKSA
jgi:two-component system chemotaxis sensor kinase CheA